jgi:superoxide dismutase
MISGKHHAGYVTKLNSILDTSESKERDLIKIIKSSQPGSTNYNLSGQV